MNYITRPLIVLLFTTLGFAQNGSKNFIDQPFIEVSGTVETKITPNEIFLKIVLDENDKKGKLSIERQENLMMTTLNGLDIDLDNNLSVLDYSGRYTKKFLGDNEVTKIKHYQLKVNNGKTLAEVYQALDQCDISNISIIKTSHTELEKFKREAKLKAIKTAKEKATGYAEAIGQTIGKALLIQEIKNYPSLNHQALNANVLNEVVVTGYGTKERQEIKNINLKPITITETVMAKFILN